MTTKPNDVLTVDLEDLTLDEVDTLETLLDAPLDALAKPGQKKAPMLRALAVVVKHREDPEAYPVATEKDRAASLKAVGSMKVNLGDDEGDSSPREPSA